MKDDNRKYRVIWIAKDGDLHKRTYVFFKEPWYSEDDNEFFSSGDYTAINVSDLYSSLMKAREKRSFRFKTYESFVPNSFYVSTKTIAPKNFNFVLGRYILPIW